MCSVTAPPVTTQTLEVVVVVSSSRPSSPRNTQASTPRRANTPAITGAIRRSAQPIACASRAGRVGDRPQEVEAGPDAQVAAGAGRVAQSRVEGGREAEGDAGLVGDPTDVVGGQVEPDAELLEDVGAPRLRGGRAVAVLDHLDAGAGGHDRRHRRDVHRERAVTAGADHVEHPTVDRERGRGGVHRVDQALHLVDGLALGAQRHREPGDLGRAGLAGEDLPHRPRRLLRAEVGTPDQRPEHLGPGGPAHPGLRPGREPASAAGG